MSPCYTLVVAMLAALQVFEVSSYSLRVSPEQLQVNIDLNHVTVTCSADVVLAGCQFHWIDRFGHAGPVLDLSNGATEYNDTGPVLDPTKGSTEYNYTGRGLAEGDCGITLEVHGKKEWMVGCRVRAALGGWQYAWMELLATDNPLHPVTVTPREAMVLPGGDLNLVCKSQRPLQGCWFNWGEGRPRTHPTISVKRALNEGDGLARGECSLTLRNVTSEDNGPASCVLRTQTSLSGEVQTGHRYIPVVVASPPSAPVLQLEYDGPVLKATCSVGPSRPVANITWLLGDEIIRQDAEDNSPARSEDAWRWPWVGGYTVQNLTRRLEPSNDGKRLRCVTSHVALTQPLETWEEISSRSYLPAKVFEPEVTTFTPNPTEPTPVNEVPSLGACIALLEVLCADNTSGVLRTSSAEVEELRLREARAAVTAAELAVETGKVLLEAARSSARVEEARARKEEILVRSVEEELERRDALQEPTTVKGDVFTLSH